MSTLRIPQQVPSPTEDCETIEKAVKGWGTDERALIKVLCYRNSSQRKLIRDTYQSLYKKSLIDTLESEVSRHFGKALILWTRDPAERDAILVHKALNEGNKGVKELQVIVEVSCASSPHHLLAVRKSYHSLFECSLEEDITANAPSSLKKILVGLASSFRFDEAVVDLNVADDEASKLQEAIAMKQLDQDVVVWILSTRNFYQLKATFESYHQKYGNFIYEDIKDCGDKKLESLVKIVIMCIISPEKHFAEVIRAAVEGLGTDEDSLTRALVCRAEIDLMKVRGAYYEMNQTSLDNAVKGDTSGDYEALLMALLGY